MSGKPEEVTKSNRLEFAELGRKSRIKKRNREV